jgi:hypothetical protein
MEQSHSLSFTNGGWDGSDGIFRLLLGTVPHF